MKKALFQSGVLLHGGKCRTRNAGFLRSFSVVLLLLPLLFAETAYGDNNTKLFEAAKAGNTAKVEQLLRKRTDVNAKHAYGRTALIAAARMGHTETVKVLIYAGADVNAKDKNGATALMDAAHRSHTEIMELLIDAAADVNATYANGATALISAAAVGHSETVKILIDAGADVNAKYENGQTALMHAAHRGRTETVKVLIDAGAGVNAQTEDGRSAVMDAARRGHTEIVKALMEAGADVNAKYEFGFTALIAAAGTGQTETVKALIDAGADVNAETGDGGTALIAAAQESHTEIVKALIAAGADVNAETEDGRSAALLIAAVGARPEIVELRVERPRTLSLSQQGSCCSGLRLNKRPPRGTIRTPAPIGERQMFSVIKLGHESDVTLVLDDLSANEYLARVDTNRNRDLTDDQVHRCHYQTCGPLLVDVKYRDGYATYEFMIRYFKMNDRPGLWYRRDTALTGTFHGRAIAVVDDNSNALYNDPEDVVVIDLNSDGVLSGGYEGAEQFSRHRPFVLDDKIFRIMDVSPTSMTMTITLASLGSFTGTVINVQTGRGIENARLKFDPGAYTATTDRKGKFLVNLPEGQYDFATISAPGFWNTILQGKDISGHIATAGSPIEMRILLEPGPCDSSLHWCGRGSLWPSSVTQSSIDLDSGVFGPRIGPAPGEMDVGWYVPVGGINLVPVRKARIANFGIVKFDSISLDELEKATYSSEKIFGTGGCREGNSHDEENVIGNGIVLGVITNEGRYSKVRIDQYRQISQCGYEISFSWFVY